MTETTEALEAEATLETPEAPAESPAARPSDAFVFERPVQTVGRPPIRE